MGASRFAELQASRFVARGRCRGPAGQPEPTAGVFMTRREAEQFMRPGIRGGQVTLRQFATHQLRQPFGVMRRVGGRWAVVARRIHAQGQLRGSVQIQATGVARSHSPVARIARSRRSFPLVSERRVTRRGCRRLSGFARGGRRERNEWAGEEGGQEQQQSEARASAQAVPSGERRSLAWRAEARAGRRPSPVPTVVVGRSARSRSGGVRDHVRRAVVCRTVGRWPARRWPVRRETSYRTGQPTGFPAHIELQHSRFGTCHSVAPRKLPADDRCCDRNFAVTPRRALSVAAAPATSVVRCPAANPAGCVGRGQPLRRRADFLFASGCAGWVC